VNRTQLIAVAAEIRRAGPGDQDAIREFLDGLSVQTRYLRFFAGFSPTSPSMLRILTGGTGDVLLARADGMVVGHAMAAYVPGPGPGGPGSLAHLGIVVADAWQGQGIGSALMDAVSPHCTMRTIADVSAVADPDTGLAIYDSTPNPYGIKPGWIEVGGTSAASPFIAGVIGLAGNGSTFRTAWLYAHPQFLNDVTVGSNGYCGGDYLCTAKKGYDGPTGMGTPDGIGAF
jgi:GNAT superfamily N-acetyltransferase